MNKTYDAQQAVAPGQPEQPAQEQEGREEINFQEFLSSLPEEFRGEIEEALVSLLNYIHSDEGTSTILNDVQSAQGNEAAQVGISALQAMDAADGEHGWSDSAKVFAGYFAVSEITLLAREAGIIDIPKEQEDKIFKKAAENYLHGLITSKPTQEEREAEAIRIQKEVEPLIEETEKARQKQSGEGQPTAEEGLLE
jgi:hypothetical protein